MQHEDQPAPDAAPFAQVLSLADTAAVPWRNGQGVTRNLLTHGEEPGQLGFQVGVAELADEAAFSDFTGLDRVFTSIGPGTVSLRFEDRPWLVCPALVPVAFGGERRLRSRVETGSVRAFNVIVARGSFTAAVSALVLPSGTTLPCPATATLAVFCVRGLVSVSGGLAIGPDQLLHATSSPGVRLMAQADSAVVVAAIDPAPGRRASAVTS